MRRYRGPIGQAANLELNSKDPGNYMQNLQLHLNDSKMQPTNHIRSIGRVTIHVSD